MAVSMQDTVFDGYYKMYQDSSGPYPVMWASRGTPYRESGKSDVVSIIPLWKGLHPNLDNTKIVVLRQFRPVINKWVWELPAGKIDEGENAQAAAIRELKEETGLTVDCFLSTEERCFPSVGIIDECHTVCTVLCSGVITDRYLEPNEQIEITPMSRRELLYRLMQEREDECISMHLQHLIQGLVLNDKLTG